MIFYSLSSFFFFWDFTFYKEDLCFITFILSLYSNTLTLESIFEYIRQKLIKNLVIGNKNALTISFMLFPLHFTQPLCFWRDCNWNAAILLFYAILAIPLISNILNSGKEFSLNNVNLHESNVVQVFEFSFSGSERLLLTRLLIRVILILLWNLPI